jgi:hypothetical protein
LARSAVVTTTAAAPSVSRQQSKRRYGAVIIGDARYASRVSGLSFITAPGFSCACFRIAIAIAPSCSGVVPNSCMWRRAMSAYHCGGAVRPYGM